MVVKIFILGGTDKSRLFPRAALIAKYRTGIWEIVYLRTGGNNAATLRGTAGRLKTGNGPIRITGLRKTTGHKIPLKKMLEKINYGYYDQRIDEQLAAIN